MTIRGILEGLASILIGLSSLYFAIRLPIGNSIVLPKTSGIMGGIAFIIIGILLIIGYLQPL